jgi:DnaJ-class molecular chaperone
MILDVEKDAFPSQIKNAYLASVHTYHPDVATSPSVHEQFLLATEAYSVLISPVRRKKYDQLYEYYLGEIQQPEHRSGYISWLYNSRFERVDLHMLSTIRVGCSMTR